MCHLCHTTYGRPVGPTIRFLAPLGSRSRARYTGLTPYIPILQGARSGRRIHPRGIFSALESGRDLPKMRNRVWTFEYAQGFAAGMTACSIVGLGVAWLFSASDTETQSVYATFAAVPVAIAAALVAMIVARYQINIVRSQDLAAARAVLPLALTRIVQISDDAISLAAGTYDPLPENINIVRQILKVDDNIIQILRDNIKSADPDIQDWISTVIGRYQVYFARLDWWCKAPIPTVDAMGRRNIDIYRQGAMMDWAMLHALSSHLFEYGRRSSERVPNKIDKKTILHPIPLDQYEFNDDFRKLADGRIACLGDGSLARFSFERSI